MEASGISPLVKTRVLPALSIEREQQGAEPNEKKEQFEVTLPDRPYKDFHPRFPLAAVDWVVRHPQGAGFIDRIKLTILEAYPGRKYEDTAITELYLCGFG